MGFHRIRIVLLTAALVFVSANTVATAEPEIVFLPVDETPVIPLVSGHTDTGALVGTTAGNFSVSDGGAANYYIPIVMVPGAAGHQPSVQLGYNSLGDNGVAGQGWSLNAGSAIRRCRQTHHTDGQMKAISFTSEDRFCLDGEKLIPLNGAPYGAVGAEYKTEIDSYARIQSFGGSVGHPDYFRVYGKDGSVREYGANENAKLRTTFNNTITIEWKQNRHSDWVGNYIDYSYTDDNRAQGESLLAAIDYTGNATAGLLPNSRVEFDYETRPDPITGYVAGSKYTISKRLKHIRVLDDAAEVRRYELSYLPIGTSLNTLSRLTSVQECAGTRCLPATTFEWQPDVMGFESQYVTNDLGMSRDVGMV
ncbi:MAG TPA: SpvB/TcaC N-terminal domain-containing protein, partial [Gammaproteobacteria bacterium]